MLSLTTSITELISQWFLGGLDHLSNASSSIWPSLFGTLQELPQYLDTQTESTFQINFVLVSSIQ